MVNRVFVRRDKKVVGPIEADVLKKRLSNGTVLASDEVSKSKTGPWQRVDLIPQLRDLISADDDEWESEDFDPTSFDFSNLTDLEAEETSVGGISSTSSDLERDLLNREINHLKGQSVGDALNSWGAVDNYREIAVNAFAQDVGSAGITHDAVRDMKLEEADNRIVAQGWLADTMGQSSGKALKRQKALMWLAEEEQTFPSVAAKWGVGFPLLMLNVMIQGPVSIVGFFFPQPSLVAAVVISLLCLVSYQSLIPLKNAIKSYPNIRRISGEPFHSSGAYLPIIVVLGLLLAGSYGFILFMLIGSQ